MNPLILKLRAFARLSAEEEAVITELVSFQRESFEPHRDLVEQGAVPRPMSVVEAGWAARYRLLEDGRRQIVALLLPGDICDMSLGVLARVDHAVATITQVTLADIPQRQLDEVIATHLRIRQALWWELLVAQAIQREWAVNLGQRTAFERVAHLLCEIYHRLRIVELTTEDSCPFPLTQTDLADTLGLSTVHINRTLQELRSEGLIVLKDRTLWIPRLDALEQAALFDVAYLHFGREGRHLDAN